MTYPERPVPSDQELEALLTDTRALLAEKERWEDDQINRDLDGLLHRVRGVKRVSYAQVMRQRAQRWQTPEEQTSTPSLGRQFPNFGSSLPELIAEDNAPEQLADQLARSEEKIRENYPEDENADFYSAEEVFESVDGEIPPDSESNF